MVVHDLIPERGKQKKVNLCEFEASLVYRMRSRTARATQRKPVSKSRNKKGWWDRLEKHAQSPQFSSQNSIKRGASGASLSSSMQEKEAGRMRSSGSSSVSLKPVWVTWISQVMINRKEE